ncbi:unnamed protein product [Trichobilharzia szidati]|nr:unnamed protein product [Trichobilharzia szidati]
MTDAGMLTVKTPTEMHDDLENLGMSFEYGCVRENNPVSCHSWAVWYQNYKKMLHKTVDIFRENCFKRHYADSCFQLGSMKVIGDTGVLRDPLEAYQAFEHGCKAGKQGKCCQAAGRLVAEGIASHTPDLSTALPLFRLGCQYNLPESCFHLGGAAMVLAKRQQVQKPIDTADSDKSVSSGSSQHHQRQQQLLSEAFKAWMDGCRLGHELSCRNIAKMYTNGDGGVEVDKVKADEYLLKAEELAKKCTKR